MLKMTYDDILIHLGEFGKYQKILYGLVSIPAIFVAMFALSSVFLFGKQDFRCRFSEQKNDTFDDEYNHTDLFQTSLNESIDKKEPKCVFIENVTEISCPKWIYDKTIFTSTVNLLNDFVTKAFDLVCDRETIPSHMNMAFFGGFFVASFTIGSVSDTIGRKPVMYIFLLIMFGSNIALPWAPNILAFGILRFLNGLSTFMRQRLCKSNARNTAMEIVGPGKRIQAGTFITFLWCIGEFILCLFAYFIRNWQDLQLAITIPMATMLVLGFFIPESPRWLIVKGKTSAARQILQKAAKTNKVDLPLDIISKNLTGEKEKAESAAVISMTYFGLTLSVGSLGGDIYINFLLSSFVELAGYISCLLLMDRIGRKRVHCGNLMIGGISCLLTIFPTLYAGASLKWTNTLLAMIGKFCISTTFAELFPTVIRGFAMGSFNIGARVAVMISPYILNLSDLVDSSFGKALPLIIFGSLGTIIAILSFNLPETLNEKLPETLEDLLEAESFKLA
ncbi:hypothetical protein KUTeg_006929 [Tegillarca granosa]|uniref:Major facilitator superfamily (MFS) profile domain-containing protein n=1 Tax=Tegillarca granosa TaxID=220873 RepID=A0ABQ9FBR8_TEGGR|nr:hypothetical protein KUTeg_006929 [Tegillarca granosa]